MSALPDFSERFKIGVTDHARWQAKERFPAFDTVLIEDEVLAAIAAGRVGLHRPWQSFAIEEADALYVWIPSGIRCYTLVADEDSFNVVTTLRAPRWWIVERLRRAAR